MIQAQIKPQVEIIHRLPGRLRLMLRPLDETKVQLLLNRLENRHGVLSITPSQSMKNLVLYYDPARTAEEPLVMNLALEWSALLGYQPTNLIWSRHTKPINHTEAVAGGLAAASAALVASGFRGLVAELGSVAAAGMTMVSVGRRTAHDLVHGKPRPEVFSLAYLLSRMGSLDRAMGSLVSWLLFHGPDWAKQLGDAKVRAQEVVPMAVVSEKGLDNKSTHYEVITRPLHQASTLSGEKLSPGVLASAVLGTVIYFLKQRT